MKKMYFLLFIILSFNSNIFAKANHTLMYIDSFEDYSKNLYKVIKQKSIWYFKKDSIVQFTDDSQYGDMTSCRIFTSNFFEITAKKDKCENILKILLKNHK